MATIHIKDGSLLVEFPDPELERALSIFDHDTGEYEQLFTRAPGRDVIVTMPGFAELAKSVCQSPRVINERRPLPGPKALPSGLVGPWGKHIEAIVKSGGIVQLTEVLGVVKTIAAILASYPKDALVDRGTPISVVASRDPERASVISEGLKALLRDREIGCVDSDDVIVTTLAKLGDVPRHLTGILICDIPESNGSREFVEDVSSFRSAVRWLLQESGVGGRHDVDIVTEGLFGQVVASPSYDDAVKAGIACPVTVCWLDAPPPKMIGMAEFRLLEANAMQESPAFVRMVSDIVRRVPGDVGCSVVTEPVAMVKRLKKSVASIEALDGDMPKRRRASLTSDIESGNVRKFVSTIDVCPSLKGIGVMVMASCKGADVTGVRIPWLERSGDRAYVVDFLHKWDVHNGRPGRLGLNDEARRKCYEAAGFNQLRVANVQQLPF